MNNIQESTAKDLLRDSGEQKEATINDFMNICGYSRKDSIDAYNNLENEQQNF